MSLLCAGQTPGHTGVSALPQGTASRGNAARNVPAGRTHRGYGGTTERQRSLSGRLSSPADSRHRTCFPGGSPVIRSLVPARISSIPPESHDGEGHQRARFPGGHLLALTGGCTAMAAFVALSRRTRIIADEERCVKEFDTRTDLLYTILTHRGEPVTLRAGAPCSGHRRETMQAPSRRCLPLVTYRYSCPPKRSEAVP